MTFESHPHNLLLFQTVSAPKNCGSVSFEPDILDENEKWGKLIRSTPNECDVIKITLTWKNSRKNNFEGLLPRYFKGILSAVDEKYYWSRDLKPRLTGAKQSLYLRLQSASLRTHVIVFRWSCVMWNNYLWDWIYILVPTHHTDGPTQPGHRRALCMWIHELGSFNANMEPERGFVKKFVSVRRQPKKREKKRENLYSWKKNKELSVGLPCCRMFCVAKTFLLCTRWSFLWYVWSYCMCYYLTHFLNVWSYVEMHHLDGFVPIWKMKTQIKVIFKNDYCLRYVIIRSSDQQGSVLKKKEVFNMLNHVCTIVV